MTQITLSKITSKILQYLQEKYTQELLDITTLDPRFKLDYVSVDKKSSVKVSLKGEMRIPEMLIPLSEQT